MSYAADQRLRERTFESLLDEEKTIRAPAREVPSPHP